MEWDKKEKQFLEEFRQKRKDIEEKWKTSESLPQNEKFEPESWKPDFSKKPKKENDRN